MTSSSAVMWLLLFGNQSFQQSKYLVPKKQRKREKLNYSIIIITGNIILSGYDQMVVGGKYLKISNAWCHALCVCVCVWEVGGGGGGAKKIFIHLFHKIFGGKANSVNPD